MIINQQGKDKTMKQPKFKIELEAPTGKIRKLTVPYILAIPIIERFLQSGWPYMIVKIDGEEIKERFENFTNVFTLKNGNQITL
jgi:hypothetical protein